MSDHGVSTRSVYGRGAAAGVVGRGVETACGLGQLWLLTRILDNHAFGRFVFAMAIVQILAVVGSAGFERLTIFRLSRSDAAPGVLAGGGFAGAVMGWGIVISTALAVFMWLGAAAVGGILGDPAVTGWLRALVWLIPVTAAAETYAAWHLARQRVSQAVLLGRGVPAIAVTLILLATWTIGLGPAGVIGAYVGGRGLALLGWWIVRPINPLLFWRHLGRADARYAAQTAATGLIHRTLRQSDVLMLLPMAGPVVTAHYAIVLRFAWLVRSGHELLGPIFAARAGHLLHRGEARAVQTELHANRMWSGLVALGLAVPLVLAGPWILSNFGDAGPAYPVLLILLADQAAFVLFGMTGLLLMMAGRSGWALSTNLFMLVANVGLNLVLIPLLGAMGAALATLTSVLVVKSFNGILVWRLERIATFGAELAVFLAAVVAALVLGAWDLVPPPAAAAVCGVVLLLLVLDRVRTMRGRLTVLTASVEAR